MKKQIHKYARILPPMPKEDYERLRDDVAEHGVIEPILIYEGEILDGIHRQRAAEETGQKPKYETYDGDEPLAMVVALNVNRRHLTASQKAAIGVELEPLFAKEAKKRQRAALVRGNKNRTDSGHVSLTGQIPGDFDGQATAEAGIRLGVDGRTVRRAKRVKSQAPDLFEKIERGELAVGTADRKLNERLGKASANGKPKERKPRSVTGNRASGRRKQLRKLDTGRLWKINRLIVDLWGALEGIDLGEEIEVDEFALSLLLDLHDDLMALDGWCDRSLRQVQTRLADVDMRAKIKVLRDTSGRTEAEAESANRMADKLEGQMERRLDEAVAGQPTQFPRTSG